MRQAIVYTETVIYSAPEQFASAAPYQIAVVTFEDRSRLLVRILGQRVQIGDLVHEVESPLTYPLFEVNS